MTEHLLEMAGALVRVSDGKIEVLSEPKVKWCPLRSGLYGIEAESRETVESVLRVHMKELGMYSPHRVLELSERPVSFGASEMISDGMKEGLVDAAVVVCEGAGTVVATRTEVVAALGAHMTGLVRTEPIEEIQAGLRERGCILLDDRCTIDQVEGYRRALAAGYERIVVTITGRRAFEAEEIRKMASTSAGEGPVIFAVHNLDVAEDQAEVLAETCDVVWACASRTVREVVGRQAKLQIGISIPVYALTDSGKRLVLNRALHFDESLVMHRATLPYGPEEKLPDPLL
ncbi:methanogenesis marker 8 protein [Methanocrinis sp.]|uniref:methanogenesis marker 8 protein n=1 Tax=Methanocrinis sp. TaxID=3101522 RepID=UPI003D0C935D